MFFRIAGFELRFQFRNPVFWVAAAFFFLLAFGSVASSNVSLGAGGNVHKNGPYVLMLSNLLFSVFFMFVTTAFVANIIVRDDDTGYGPIVRSTRITKFDYLFGRFLGAFAAAAIAFLAVPIGMLVGSMMPWVDPETLGPTRLADYAYAYFVFGLPNVFLTSAIFFALATMTRSMMGTYIGVIVFFVGRSLTTALVAQRPEMRGGLAIGEPFGAGAFGEVTRYWTAAERNSVLPPLDGVLLENRLLWLAIAIACLAIAYFAYKFADKGMSKRQARKQKLAEKTAVRPASAVALEATASPRHDARTARAQFWTQTWFEMKQVFRSPAFGILLAIGVMLTAPLLWIGGDLFGTPTIPVTRSMIPTLQGAFGIFPIIIAIYYAGDLVWRERDRKVHEIIDATPIPNWAYIVPKTIAVALVLLSILLVSVVVAVTVQTIKGYTNFEFGKYLLWYIVPMTFDMTLLAILAVFVQSISPNKYVGWGIMVLYIIATIVLSSLGFEHKLYLYGGTPSEPLSDMNGAGMYWKGAWWFRLYWGAFAAILLVVAHLLWRRGTETRLKPRLTRLPGRLKGAPGLIAGLAALILVGTGAWIFYNTNILNEYRTDQGNEEYLAQLEKKYLKYASLPQPTIKDVKLNVALYPDQIRAVVHGSYLLRNLTDKPIRDVHVRVPGRDLELVGLDFPGAKLVSNDKKFGYRIYRLDQPMMPGEARRLSFETVRDQNGFRNSGNDTRLVGNGTFLTNFELAPAIGMSRNGLLQDRTKRRKYGLPAELRPAKLEDLSATNKNYIGGGWTTADITVSTKADQIPIAPGKKVSEVVKDGRRIARFVSEAPILNFFSIQSARYAIKHQNYKGVDLAIYYHPAHEWNVDRMLKALEYGLDYYQKNFGPYQFDQVRILEFPAYAQFAQSFANTIPFSEGIGFIADTSDPDKIDYVTYVTAHELGHQWWAHQIVGADMQGATMLSETLAQYSALMVMKHLYGEDQIRRFLKYELDNYLRSRATEAVEEQPLERVENQQYIHYRKGSLVMYLLQDRLGEAAVNRAIRTVLDKYKFKGAPYPRSADLVEALRAEAKTPEDQALITDLFEKITIYDLKVDEPKAVRRADGKWDVTVPVEAKKFYADGKGNETETPLNDRIPIGLFTAEPGRGKFDRKDVILMERRPVHSGKQVFRFVTDRKPTHAGVDPYNFYIDRNSDDNVKQVI